MIAQRHNPAYRSAYSLRNLDSVNWCIPFAELFRFLKKDLEETGAWKYAAIAEARNI